jgi:predicted secreted protein
MRFIPILLAAAAGLSAQQPNTVTASVAITQSTGAGTANFRIQLGDASANSSVDSTLATLAPAGVTAAQLNGVSVEINQGFVITTYDFRVPVPAGELGSMRDKLIGIQRALANSQTQGIGWSSTQTPTDEELAIALEQALPSLMEKARQRAGLLAQAMNATLGAVVKLSAPAIAPDGPTVTVSLTATYAVTPVQ